MLGSHIMIRHKVLASLCHC